MKKEFETPGNRPTQYGDWYAVASIPAEASIEIRTTAAQSHDVTVTTRYQKNGRTVRFPPEHPERAYEDSRHEQR